MAECWVCMRRLQACRLCIRTNRCADPSLPRDTREDGSAGGITEEDMRLDDIVEQIEQGGPLGQGILPIEECPSVAGPQEIPRSAIAMAGAYRSVLSPARLLPEKMTQLTRDLFGHLRGMQARTPIKRFENQQPLFLGQNSRGLQRLRDQAGECGQSMSLPAEADSASLVSSQLCNCRARSPLVQKKCDEPLRVVGLGDAIPSTGRHVGTEKVANRPRGSLRTGQQLECPRERRTSREFPSQQRSSGYRLVHGEGCMARSPRFPRDPPTRLGSPGQPCPSG